MQHRRRILILLILTFFFVSTAPSGNINSYANIGSYANDAAFAEFKELFSDVDEDTMAEAFDFLQKKAADGSLDSEDGIENAIKEGKQKFGVDIDGVLDEKHIKSMIELATTLEEMGFNSEKIVEKAKSMYEKYGIDFIDHTEELIYEVVSDSITMAIRNAINEFFRIIGEFFRSLLNSLRK